MSFLDLYQGVLLNVGLLEMGVLVEFDDGWTVDVSEVPDGRLVEIADGTFVWKSGRSGPGHRHEGESLRLRPCVALGYTQGSPLQSVSACGF